MTVKYINTTQLIQKALHQYTTKKSYKIFITFLSDSGLKEKQSILQKVRAGSSIKLKKTFVCITGRDERNHIF